MKEATQFAAELQALRALCDDAATPQDRLNLLQSLSEHAFLSPEHQVVFESIRALLVRGPLSVDRLRVHLNNRGFPDTDVETYFQPARENHIALSPADESSP